MNKKYYYPEKKADKNIFSGEKNKHITKYNLPQKVEYCKNWYLFVLNTIRGEWTVEREKHFFWNDDKKYCSQTLYVEATCRMYV